MENFKNYFDLNSSEIYLNNGTHSIIPKVVFNALQKYQQQYENNPTLGLLNSWDQLWIVQKKLAHFLNARPADLFFRSNVTKPMNEFIMGHPLSAGDEILTNNQEYGAVWNMCRFRVEKDNLSLRQFQLPNKNEVGSFYKNDYLELIKKSLSSKTKMLVLSEIFSPHGLVLPIKEISEETAKRGIVLVVDGAHSPGSLDINFSDYQNVDYYGGNLHKWLMAPKGTAFGWIHPRRRNDFKRLEAGWPTYELGDPLLKFGEGDLFATRMLMLGCHDFAPFFAVSETIDFWNQIGKQNILSRMKEIGQYTVAKVKAEIDLPHFASADLSCRGPLHSFLLPKKFQGKNYADIMRAILKECGVQVSIANIDGELYLRLSPHIYNTQEEIDLIIPRLKKFLF